MKVNINGQGPARNFSVIICKLLKKIISNLQVTQNSMSGNSRLISIFLQTQTLSFSVSINNTHKKVMSTLF